tara:strand:+ start:587 stop:928 length:342 start_codon:yes stop_codon:yes gene_type:complete
VVNIQKLQEIVKEQRLVSRRREVLQEKIAKQQRMYGNAIESDTYSSPGKYGHQTLPNIKGSIPLNPKLDKEWGMKIKSRISGVSPAHILRKSQSGNDIIKARKMGAQTVNTSS